MFTLYMHLFSSHVCMLHVCVCVGVYMHMGVPGHVCLCVPHVYLCGCVHVWVHLHVCAYVCMCVCKSEDNLGLSLLLEVISLTRLAG